MQCHTTAGLLFVNPDHRKVACYGSQSLCEMRLSVDST